MKQNSKPSIRFQKLILLLRTNEVTVIKQTTQSWMNLSKKRTSPAVPPEKGSFPLDHWKECNAEFQVYNDCLKLHEGVQRYCVDLSKAYLNCRMDK